MHFKCSVYPFMLEYLIISELKKLVQADGESVAEENFLRNLFTLNAVA